MRRRAVVLALGLTLIPAVLLVLVAAPASGDGRVPASPATAVLEATPTTSEGGTPGADAPRDRFRNDPAANAVAVAVLGLMVLGLARSAWPARRRGVEADQEEGPGLVVLLLALAGLGLAAYLTSLEAGSTDCGPVGGCSAVPQEWAKPFGVVPVGLIGVAGYAVVLAAWVAARRGRGRHADWARVALLGGALIGVVFAVYLTLVEPLAAGATCMWCLSSAVIVTALVWVTIRPASAAWRRLRRG